VLWQLMGVRTLTRGGATGFRLLSSRPAFGRFMSTNSFAARGRLLGDSRAARFDVAGRADAAPDLHRAAGALMGWVARDQLAVAKRLPKR
jgi:hypothetical protein